jgi:hypothetical protein
VAGIVILAPAAPVMAAANCTQTSAPLEKWANSRIAVIESTMNIAVT